MMLIDGLGKGLILHSCRRWSEKLSLLAVAIPMRFSKLFLFWAVLCRTFWDIGVEIRSVLT